MLVLPDPIIDEKGADEANSVGLTPLIEYTNFNDLTVYEFNLFDTIELNCTISQMISITHPVWKLLFRNNSELILDLRKFENA